MRTNATIDSWYSGRRITPGTKPSNNVLDLIGEHVPWMADGLCSQTDPEAFYPEKGGSTREAKAVCRRCPVIDECLAYALEHVERHGIWGGLSERERRRLKKANPTTPAEPRVVVHRDGPHNSQTTLTRLAELGVTSRDVRTWAINTGIPHVPDRGLVSLALIDRYAAAHTRQEHTA